MKLIGYFNAFMTNTVNLKKSKLEKLAVAVEALYDAIAADDVIGPLVIGKEPQGSWAHETIINPVSGREFDADFMLLLKENPDWSEHPSRYIDELHKALKRHGTYKSMVVPPKCRCVRVVYAGDYHVDIVPFLTLADGRQVIVNGDADDWEDTDPDGFTSWMKAKTDATGGHLKRVIRLLKYIRDHREHFTRTRSVILTAIVSERIDESLKLSDPDYYGDLPTAFYHIINDLNEWLVANPSKPSIVDPSGATDPSGHPVTFDHRWTAADYQNFRGKVATLARDVSAAYEETDQKRSVELWQGIFGSEFDVSRASGSALDVAGPIGAGTASVNAPRGG